MFLVYLLGVVLFFSFLANFAFRKIFKSLSWVDKPDGVKKLHKNDIPLSGGISFIASLMFAVLIFDFFAGVNFNLSWNGFFVGDSIKEDSSLNQNINEKIDLIGNDSFEIKVVEINENSQAVLVINKNTFETELMEVYKDETSQLNKWNPEKIKELIYLINDIELQIKKDYNNSILIVTDFILAQGYSEISN